MTRSLVLLAAASLALGAGLANATGGDWPAGAMPSETQKPEFMNLDTDQDGSISKTEAEAHSALQAEFDNLDANNNGSLDEAEFARFEAEPGGGMEQPMEEGK